MKTYDEIKEGITKLCKEDVGGGKGIDENRRLNLYADLLSLVDKAAEAEATMADRFYNDVLNAIHDAAAPSVNKCLADERKKHEGDSLYMSAIEKVDNAFNG